MNTQERELLQSTLVNTSAYIFDMDGTVVNLETLNLTAFQEVIRSELKRELTNEEFQEHISGRGSLNGLEEYLKSLNYDSVSAPMLQEKYREIKRDSLANRFNEVVTVVDGASELLAQLKQKGKKTCLATSTGSEFAEKILTGTDLKRYFDIVVTRDDVRKIKPHPEIFKLALKKLGTTSSKTIVFEDSLNGIIAAQKAGIFCLGIRNPGFNDKYVENADLVIDDFVGITSLIT